MKKRIRSLIAISMVSLIIFGCSNTDNVKNTESAGTETTKTDNASPEVSTTEEVEPAPSQYPDYLNLESARPIIKEGEEVTLKLLIRRERIANSDINENWFVKFIEEKLNINLDIEEATVTTYEERRNLILASNDLPDMMFNMNLKANDIVTYGVDGGLFLPMSDYINEELTPNIMEALKDQEAAVIENTASDGKMYTLPIFYANYPGFGNTMGSQRIFIDKKYMEAAGITELPETLDEFVEMLRIFKKLDPAQMGTKEIWPMVATKGDDLGFLQNAFGWVQRDNKQLTIPVWDVETNSVEIPVAQEKYGEYVKLLNTLYSEGLIHPDFFTIDKTVASGLYAEGSVPVMAAESPYVYLPTRFEEFVAANPVSSKWCENGVTTASNSYDLGRIQISADTKYKEVCMRLLDYLYSPEGSVYCLRGCPADSEDLMGLNGGFYLGENGATKFTDVESGKYESDFDYQVNAIEITGNSIIDERHTKLYAQELLGVKEPKYPELDLKNPDDHYRFLCYDAHQGHLVTGLPSAYMSSDVVARWTDLKSVIQNYVDGETAKFVVGQRPISELDQYFEELKELGIDEFVEIGKSMYKNYKGPQA